MNVDRFNILVRTVIEGRSWIVLGDGLASAQHLANTLLDLGATRVMALGASRDIETKAVAPDYPVIVLNIEGTPGSIGHIRACSAAFRELPTEFATQIEAWDPGKDALVLTPPWADDQPFQGRKVFGARWPRWQLLEDKMTCDAIWDGLQIPRAPARVLPVYQSALQTAHQELDHGMGTVWAGDNKEGWHGGAEYLRWIRTDGDFRAAFPFFRSHCDQVRIQPFLDGIPCSIHGMVFPDSVITFRPCEMLVFRQTNSTRLRYGGSATTWDPPDSDRLYMKRIAQMVGANLRRNHGYRGVFTIDGVMTSEGFRPTELNPRYGAAIPRLTSGVRTLPFYLLNKIVCEGIALPYSPQDLERLIVESADKHRVVWSNFSLAGHTTSARKQILRFQRTNMGWSENTQGKDAVVTLQPSTGGGFLKIVIEPHQPSIGRSQATEVADLARLSDKKMRHGLNKLEAAPDLRSQ